MPHGQAPHMYPMTDHDTHTALDFTPFGSDCTGDSNNIQTQEGFWKAPEEPGQLEAIITLQGIPSEYATGSQGAVFQNAFEGAMAAITDTGADSVTVSNIAWQGGTEVPLPFSRAPRSDS